MEIKDEIKVHLILTLWPADPFMGVERVVGTFQQVIDYKQLGL